MAAKLKTAIKVSLGLCYSLICAVGLYGVISVYNTVQYERLTELVGPEVRLDIATLAQKPPLFGDANAEFQLIEFMDYECGPCRAEYKVIKRLHQNPRFSHSVRHHPITRIHPYAKRAAILCESLPNQEDKQQMHESLLQGKLCKDFLDAMETTACAKQCIDLRAGEITVEKDGLLSEKVGISHTPTLYLIAKNRVFEVKDPHSLDLL